MYVCTYVQAPFRANCTHLKKKKRLAKLTLKMADEKSLNFKIGIRKMNFS
jgi:hypothetical protein